MGAGTALDSSDAQKYYLHSHGNLEIDLSTDVHTLCTVRFVT